MTVRVTPEEKNMAETLAVYLHKVGKIEEPTLSNAVRMSLRFTVSQILQGIEAERYAR